ncbi:MAG TPA: MerR family transcriptional regulator, partial [Ktedonobacteraceae bacterium]|nr:MerR family transcriptional regulator [Ktedonobacteraceae bacterium]
MMRKVMRETIHMLKIGEFAQVGQVSIATLRHYDQLGLLKPIALDPLSGYRYYALDQLPRLNRILVLKDLGFPLDQISQLLAKNLSLEELRGMLLLKQEQTRQVIEVEQARLVRLAARIRQLELEETMPAYDVRLKTVDPICIASIRTRLPHISERGPLYQKLAAYLEEQSATSSTFELLILHSRHTMHEDGMSIDVEAALPVSAGIKGREPIQIRTLPETLVASTVHTGDDLSLGQAYVALYRWLEDNGYRIVAPVRQLHLRRSPQLAVSEYVTEVQFPVERYNT